MLIPGGYVLTCNHVIENQIQANADIGIQLQQNHINCDTSEYITDTDRDLALLKVPLDLLRIRYWTKDISYGDEIICHGYESGHAQLRPYSFEVVGFEGLPRRFMRIKEDAIPKGLSGAPLFNKDDFSFYGIITTTLGRDVPLGGYAIPFDIISESHLFKHIHIGTNKSSGNLLTPVEYYSLSAKNYSNSGIGFYDQSSNDNHYCIYNYTNLAINDLFIKPRGTIINYNSCEVSGRNPLEPLDADEITHQILENLTNSRVFLVTGRYGCGKTILSKKIQYILSEKGYDTVFLKARDLFAYNNYTEISQAINDRTAPGINLVLIIDAVEDLFTIGSHNEYRTNTIIRSLFGCLRSNSQVYYILNYRLIPDSNDSIHEEILLSLEEFARISMLSNLELRYFTKDSIEKYLDRFSSAVEVHTRATPLFISELKGYHKNFLKACENPIFLFMVCDYYYGDDFDDIGNAYSLYKNFVEKTIKGRFLTEAPHGSASLAPISNEYHKFVSMIAVEIGKRARLDIDDDLLDNWHLDSNKANYGIIFNELDDVINKFFLQIRSSLHEFTGRRISDRMMNCYFFSFLNGLWKFRDNNILFFLIADHIFSILDNALNIYVQDPHNNVLSSYLALNEISEIGIHPLTIELLFSRIDTLEHGEYNRLAEMILSYIQKDIILSINEWNLEKLNVGKVKLDLLLLLIFLKYNENNYSELEYYFKRLHWHVSAVKSINPDICYIAKRFHRDAKISNIEIRRVNLKEYNFSGASFQEVKLIQNKMNAALLRHNNFRKTSFYLCELDNTILSPTGEINLDYCRAKRLIIQDPANFTLKIRRSFIETLQVKCNRRVNTVINIEINESTLADIIITSSRVNKFSVSRCIISSIKFVRSDCNLNILYPTIKLDKYFTAKGNCNISFKIKTYWD